MHTPLPAEQSSHRYSPLPCHDCCSPATNPRRRQRHAARAMVWSVFAGVAALPAALAAQGPTGYVRRDPNLGVPHITAPNEAAAWYALGYEQARDGLLFLQYACRAARGNLTSLRGDEGGLVNDLAVKILGADLRQHNLSTTELRALFSPSSPASPAGSANFYDNLVAFAEGANDYRELVKNTVGGPPSPENSLRQWLDATYFPVLGTNGVRMDWVYNDPIEAIDLASHGGWTSAVWSFLNPWPKLVNSNGISYQDADDSPGVVPPGERVDPELVGDPLDPSSAVHHLQQMRQYASGLCGMASAMSGSNSFGWSHDFCKDPASTTTYAGLVADPHQAVPFHSPNFIANFRQSPNHMWFAHVQVTPPGASTPSYDVFGHVPYGAATFQSCHNRTLAMGGTAGAPNWRDHFLLRLEDDPTTGLAVAPERFYSHYWDTAPGTNATYRALSMHWITITRPDGLAVPVNYWRAESFGIVLPDDDALLDRVVTWNPAQPQPPLPLPIVYGERVKTQQSPPRWRVDTRSLPPPPKMRYWATPQFADNGEPTTSPMIVTLRVAMDRDVAGNPRQPTEWRHWRLARDFWELSHLGAVTDPLLLPNTDGGAYPVNVCFADSQGRTLTTVLTAIPARGVDADIAAAGYSAVDKYVFYSGLAGPVPARHYADRMFDWQFGATTNRIRPEPLRYLTYPVDAAGTPVTPTSPFKAFTRQDPTGAAGAVVFPPTQYGGSGNTFHIQSGFFASACNDSVWGYSRRVDRIKWSELPPTGPNGLNNLLVIGNWLLTQALDQGAAYQSAALSFEAPVNQQIVVDQFTRIAEHVVTQGSAGHPPLSPAAMRAFVVSPKLFSSPTYVPPAGITANAALPAPVRQFKEVRDNHAHAKSPLTRARREIQFFQDLWAELHNPASLWRNHAVHGSTVRVDLQRIWVVGDQPNLPSKIFFYTNPTNPSAQGSLQWIDMPPGFQLIDFLWSETDLGHGLTGGLAASNNTVLTPTEKTRFDSLVDNVLVAWDGQGDYVTRPNSQAACLLEMARMGYGADRSYGRKWLRLHDGAAMFRFNGATTPVPLNGGQLPSAPGSLVREEVLWQSLAELAFPGFQHTTLFEGGLEPPYDALYEPNTNPPRARTTLGPTEVNELVKFLLQLGGHYIDPAHNQGNPSRKLARWKLVNEDATQFRAILPPNYPLTGGMERLTAVRHLLAADDFLARTFGPTIPPLRNVFTSRAYSHDALPTNPPPPPVWPSATQPGNPDYFGPGLRAVSWHADTTPGSGFMEHQGFQNRFLGMGGSYATLLTLFPSQGIVDSFFWCTPGVRAMTYDTNRFQMHMDAHASNTLLPSQFTNFLGFPAVPFTYP